MHGRPARVVEDDVEHRQAHAFADEMAGRRVAEHVGAVAEGRDQRLVGRGELRAERGAQAPAQAARGRVAEVAHRLADRQLLEQDRVLVDEDRVVGQQPVHALRCEPGSHRSRAAARLATGRGRLRSHGLPSIFYSRGRSVSLRTLAQGVKRRRDAASEREVGPEPAQRIARKERVGADMDHFRFGPGIALRRQPRHVAIDHQDQVGLRQQGLRIPARGERMLGRQRQIARTVVDDRNGKGLGELLDGTRRFDAAAAVRRDQQGPVSLSEQFCCFVQRVGVRRGRRGGRDGGAF